MLPADMTGGASPKTAADLTVGAGVLTTFKQRIDKLLSEFEDSAARRWRRGTRASGRGGLRGWTDVRRDPRVAPLHPPSVCQEAATCEGAIQGR